MNTAFSASQGPPHILAISRHDCPQRSHTSAQTPQVRACRSDMRSMQLAPCVINYRHCGAENQLGKPLISVCVAGGPLPCENANPLALRLNGGQRLEIQSCPAGSRARAGQPCHPADLFDLRVRSDVFWRLTTPSYHLLTGFYSGTTAIASISSRKSGLANSATYIIDTVGGFLRLPHTCWNTSKPGCSGWPWTR